MRLLFAGTPRFSAVILEAILEAGHEVPLVLTQPDRPAGRGMKLVASEVKSLALTRGLEVLQPITLKDPVTVDRLRQTEARTMVVAAYGLILPLPVLAAFPLGCLNVHASLLPRWRGAAPIQRAILAGDNETGVCIMQMEAGLDTGPVFDRTVVKIRNDETAGALHDRLAAAGAALMVGMLARLERGDPVATPQPEDGVTYAHKIRREDAAIDWQADAAVVDRVIRAFNPVPGAYSGVRGETVKLWRAEPVPGATAGEPGQILAAGADAIVVACGQGSAIRLTELQRAGGKRLPARDFLRGFALDVGERFATPGS